MRNLRHRAAGKFRGVVEGAVETRDVDARDEVLDLAVEALHLSMSGGHRIERDGPRTMKPTVSLYSSRCGTATGVIVRRSLRRVACLP